MYAYINLYTRMHDYTHIHISIESIVKVDRVNRDG